MNAKRLVVMVCVGVLLASRGQAAKQVAVADLKTALEQAKSEGKMVFILYGREACGNCQALRKMIASGDVRISDKEFVYADINCDDPKVNQAFGQRYKVDGNTLPFVVIAGSDGKQLASHTGYGDKDAFEALIHDAEKSTPKKAATTTKPTGTATAAAAKKVARDETRETRLWISKGGAKVEASLVEESGAYVVLRKADGSKVQIFLSSLSSDDQAYVADIRSGGAKTADKTDGKTAEAAPAAIRK